MRQFHVTERSTKQIVMKIGTEPTKGYKAYPCLKNLTTNLHSEQ